MIFLYIFVLSPSEEGGLKSNVRICTFVYTYVSALRLDGTNGRNWTGKRLYNFLKLKRSTFVSVYISGLRSLGRGLKANNEFN